MNNQNCIQCDLILPELEDQLDKYRTMVMNLEEEIRSIESQAQELEDKKPMILVDSLVGEVVPIMDYMRLQLASAKARVVLQTKVEMLEKKLK
jgi:hypothetical protein